MEKIVGGIEYLDTQGVLEAFDNAPKKRFYSNIKPYLTPKTFGGKRKPWYNKRDVLALKEGKPVRKASIPLTGGVQKSWTASIRAMGYNAHTLLDGVETTTLPQDAIEIFQLPADKKFFKKTSSTWVEGKPICTWSTYYPLDLVEDSLDDIKQGVVSDVVEHIKEKHGIVVGLAKERTTARITTFDEHMKFQLLNEEAVLILQRVSYTHDRKVLVFYSDMVLLGSWFAPEHEYDVNVFD
jgi:hypothetical protein